MVAIGPYGAAELLGDGGVAEVVAVDVVEEESPVVADGMEKVVVGAESVIRKRVNGGAGWSGTSDQ